MPTIGWQLGVNLGDAALDGECLAVEKGPEGTLRSAAVGTRYAALVTVRSWQRPAARRVGHYGPMGMFPPMPGSGSDGQNLARY